MSEIRTISLKFVRHLLPKPLIIGLVMIFGINLAAINYRRPVPDPMFARMYRLIEWRDPVTQEALRLPIDHAEPISTQILTLSQVEEIDMQGVNLTELPDEFGYLSELQSLNIGFAGIQKLPPTFTQLTSLTSLNIYGNKLSNIDLIMEMTWLEWLDLSSMDIVELPPEIGNLTNLRVFVCQECGLVSLPDEFTQLSKLEWLYLSFNEITELPVDFGDLKRLSELFMLNNQLTSLPPSITELTQLEEVSFSTNNLTSLPDDIDAWTNLRALDVKENRLGSIPPTVGNLEALLFLDISANQLTAIPVEIGSLPNLEVLDVRYNNLQQDDIPDEVWAIDDLDIWWE